MLTFLRPCPWRCYSTLHLLTKVKSWVASYAFSLVAQRHSAVIFKGSKCVLEPSRSDRDDTRQSSSRRLSIRVHRCSLTLLFIIECSNIKRTVACRRGSYVDKYLLRIMEKQDDGFGVDLCTNNEDTRQGSVRASTFTDCDGAMKYQPRKIDLETRMQ